MTAPIELLCQRYRATIAPFTSLSRSALLQRLQQDPTLSQAQRIAIELLAFQKGLFEEGGQVTGNFSSSSQ